MTCRLCDAWGSPCPEHVVDPVGLDDDRVGAAWPPALGVTEIDAETNRRWCDLIHRGVLDRVRRPPRG